ncbi:MAG: HAD family hydrolase [Calditrichaceae bacterium]
MRKKLLLFDIDGTLLLGRGIPKKVFLEVVRHRFPDYQNGETLRFSGMTDPKIVHDLLMANGFKEKVTPELETEILDEFVRVLEERITPENPPLVLPGVVELLDRCTREENIFLGLVTGNIMQGARIKLTAAGLYHYFAVGAFGSDHIDRAFLPPLAISRSEKYFGQTFAPEDVWIIGDSIHDVTCAKANKLKCLAVYTGFTSKDELLDENPEYLLENFLDTNNVMSIFEDKLKK